MGWQLYNSNYNDASRTALWYAFEISLDDGANWTTNDLFYRTYSNYHYNADLAVGNSDVTGIGTASLIHQIAIHKTEQNIEKDS